MPDVSHGGLVSLGGIRTGPGTAGAERSGRKAPGSLPRTGPARLGSPTSGARTAGAAVVPGRTDRC